MISQIEVFISSCFGMIIIHLVMILPFLRWFSRPDRACVCSSWGCQCV